MRKSEGMRGDASLGEKRGKAGRGRRDSAVPRPSGEGTGMLELPLQACAAQSQALRVTQSLHVPVGQEPCRALDPWPGQ